MAGTFEVVALKINAIQVGPAIQIMHLRGIRNQ